MIFIGRSGSATLVWNYRWRSCDVIESSSRTPNPLVKTDKSVLSEMKRSWRRHHGLREIWKSILHSLSTEQLINPELNQPMNQKIMGAAHFLDIIRPVEYKLTSQKSSRLSDLPTSSSVPCDLSFYLYLSVSQSESSFLSLPCSLPRSFNLSPTETWSETKKPSSSTEAKPEITAPILDSFPASLPPATACGAQTGFPAHRYSESSPWFFHDRLVAKRPRIQTTTFKISCCASRFFFFF